jgi:hypothetical protein
VQGSAAAERVERIREHAEICAERARGNGVRQVALTARQKMDVANKHKSEGNEHFKGQKWREALTSYHKV